MKTISTLSAALLLASCSGHSSSDPDSSNPDESAVLGASDTPSALEATPTDDAPPSDSVAAAPETQGSGDSNLMQVSAQAPVVENVPTPPSEPNAVTLAANDPAPTPAPESEPVAPAPAKKKRKHAAKHAAHSSVAKNHVKKKAHPTSAPEDTMSTPEANFAQAETLSAQAAETPPAAQEAPMNDQAALAAATPLPTAFQTPIPAQTAVPMQTAIPMQTPFVEVAEPKSNSKLMIYGAIGVLLVIGGVLLFRRKKNTNPEFDA